MKQAPNCDVLRGLLNTPLCREKHGEIEQAIAHHLSVCSVCAADERALASLVTTYLSLEPALSAEFEQRLIERMCQGEQQVVSKSHLDYSE